MLLGPDEGWTLILGSNDGADDGSVDLEGDVLGSDEGLLLGPNEGSADSDGDSLGMPLGCLLALGPLLG